MGLIRDCSIQIRSRMFDCSAGNDEEADRMVEAGDVLVGKTAAEWCVPKLFACRRQRPRLWPDVQIGSRQVAVAG